MDSTRPLDQIQEELRQALAQPAELSADEREALRASAREIRAALSRPGAEGDEDEGSLSDQLQGVLERFEGQHPKLTQVVGRVADALSDLGI